MVNKDTRRELEIKYRNNSLLKVYKAISEKIDSWISDIEDPESRLSDLDNLWSCVTKGTYFARIILGDDLDPNEVFDRLNDIGIKLTNHELLRNFLLQNASSNRNAPNHATIINQAYSLCLKDFDEKFPKDRDIDVYILAIAQIIDPSAKGRTAFSVLKKYYSKQVLIRNEKSGGQSKLRQDFVDASEELTQYQPIFLAIRDGDLGDSVFTSSPLSKTHQKKVKSTIQRLHAFSVDEATYPYLLQLIKGMIEGKVEINEGLNCLKLVETYLIRRGIYGAFRKGLNSFSGLWDRSKEVGSYYTTLYATLTDDELDSSDKFVLDKQLKEFITGKSDNTAEGIYKKNKIKRFLLWEYELSLNGRNQKFMPDTYEIDHVIPQQITKSDLEKWPGLNWEDYRTWKHKWANLMPLTKAENIYKSNKTWAECREELTDDQGVAKSLCQSASECLNQEKWNNTKLTSRASKIYDFVIEKWPIPEEPKDLIKIKQKLVSAKENS